MNRSLPAVALLALFTASPLLAQGAKPRVAILEFKNKASHYTWSWYEAGRQAQDMLVTELVKSGKYRVIEREQLQAIMQEKHLSLSGDIDPKTAIQFGKMLGVEYLIAGAVTELGVTDRNASVPGGFLRGLPSVSVRSQKMEAALDARAFSTSTGEIVWADTAKDETSDSSVYVAGAGGGANDRNKVDKLMRPVVQKLAASLARRASRAPGSAGRATRRASSARLRRPTAARYTSTLARRRASRKATSSRFIASANRSRTPTRVRSSAPTR